MIKHVYTVLCQSTTVDSDSSSLSMFGVIESLQVSLVDKQFADQSIKRVVPIKYELISAFDFDERIKEEYLLEMKMVIRGPNGDVIANSPIEVLIPKNTIRYRYRSKISGFPVTSSGRYLVSLDMKKAGGKRFSNIFESLLDVVVEKACPSKEGEL